MDFRSIVSGTEGGGARHPLADLEARNIDRFLGARERATKEIRAVIADPAPFVPLSMRKRM